jgi:hypothetical protein
VDALLLQTPAQLPQHLKAPCKHDGPMQIQLASRWGIKQARYTFIESHPFAQSAPRKCGIIACGKPWPHRCGRSTVLVTPSDLS